MFIATTRQEIRPAPAGRNVLGHHSVDGAPLELGLFLWVVAAYKHCPSAGVAPLLLQARRPILRAVAFVAGR